MSRPVNQELFEKLMESLKSDESFEAFRKNYPTDDAVNICNDEGDTALILVAFTGNLEMTKRLLTAGADPRIKNATGITALRIAAAKNHHEAFAEMLNHLRTKYPAAEVEKVINAQDGKGGTALMWAASKGNLEMTQQLLDAGADPRLKNETGMIALQIAAADNHHEVLAEILNHLRTKYSAAEAEKVINAQDTEGSTALMWAASKGHLKITQQLLDAGADPRLKNTTGMTALLLAASDNRHEALAEILNHLRKTYPTEAEEVINAQDSKGSTALMWAAFTGNPEMTKRLLTAGADPKIKNETGITALRIAAAKNHHEAFAEMLNHLRTKYPAAEAEKVINAQDGKGATFLMWAASKGNLEMTQQLLDAGADPLLRNTARKLPWHIARDSPAGLQNPAVVALLKKAAETKLEEQLEKNRKSRKAKAERHWDGAMFGEGGVIELYKMTEGVVDKNKLKALIEMLGIIDETVIQNLQSRKIKVPIGPDGSGEVIDKPLKKLIAFLGNGAFTPEEVEDLQRVFVRLVHFEFSNKTSKEIDGRTQNFADTTLVIGHKGVPLYFNDYHPVTMEPQASKAELEREIASTMLEIFEKNKLKLETELQKLINPSASAAAGAVTGEKRGRDVSEEGGQRKRRRVDHADTFKIKSKETLMRLVEVAVATRGKADDETFTKMSKVLDPLATVSAASARSAGRGAAAGGGGDGGYGGGDGGGGRRY